jgi:hypothetical protein
MSRNLLRFSTAAAVFLCGAHLGQAAQTAPPPAAAPAPANPAAREAALKLKEQFARSRQMHADMIRRIADEEFRASDPALSADDRKLAAQVASVSRTAERLTRSDGEMRAKQFAMLNQQGVADQTKDEALLEANVYALRAALKQQLQLFTTFYEKDEGAKKGALPRHVFFGRDLAAYAATLPVEGRRAKLQAWMATHRPPADAKNVELETQNTLRGVWLGRFNALQEIFGDAVTGLEAAELLVQLDGYTAEAHARLAEMQARNGRRAEALCSLDVALGLDAKHERALKWEKQLTEHAPELYMGVVEEPADKMSVAAVGVMEMFGETPKDRQLMAIEAAARTAGRRIQAALRAPIERRKAAVTQALALHAELKGKLINPTKAVLVTAQTTVNKAFAEKDVAATRKAFDAAPLETSTHVVYWQLRALACVLEKNYPAALDCVLVVEGLEAENPWAKANRPRFERLTAGDAPKPVTPVEKRGALTQTVMAAMRKLDLPAAEAAVTAALATKADDPEALLLSSRVKAAKRDLAGTQADLVKVIASGGRFAAEAHGLSALIALSQSKLADAQASLAKAFALDANQPDALFAQAQMEAQQKQVPAAQEKLTRALAGRPDLDDAVIMQAMLLNLSGKAAEGAQALEKLLTRNPCALPARAQLLQYYLANGRPIEARRQVTEVTKLNLPLAAPLVAQMETLIKQHEAARATTPMARPASATTPPPAGAPAPTRR